MNYRQKVGAFGEGLAEKYLIKKGYKIIEKNVRLGNKEIDIIAKINDIIVVIEVKSSMSKPLESVDDNMGRKKISNLKNALMSYLAQNYLDPDAARIDLITIDINRPKKIANIKHFKDIY